jgi:hypothetical protein
MSVHIEKSSLAIQEELNDLNNMSYKQVGSAIQNLLTYNDPMVLGTLLNHKKTNVRQTTFDEINKHIADKNLQETLIVYLSNPGQFRPESDEHYIDFDHKEFRRQYTNMVGNFAQSITDPSLLNKLLAVPHIIVMIPAREALGESLDKEYVQLALMKSLEREEDCFARLNTAKALLNLDRKAVVPTNFKEKAYAVILPLLNDSIMRQSTAEVLISPANNAVVDPAVKIQAFLILVNSLGKNKLDWFDSAEISLEPAANTIKDLLQGKTPEGLKWPKKFLHKLVTCLNHKNPEIRKVAIYALAPHAVKEPKNPLGILKEKIFQHSGWVIGKRTPSLALAHSALNDHNPDVQLAAMEVFAANPKSEFSQWVLQQGLNHSNEDIRAITKLALESHAETPAKDEVGCENLPILQSDGNQMVAPSEASSHEPKQATNPATDLPDLYNGPHDFRIR